MFLKLCMYLHTINGSSQPYFTRYIYIIYTNLIVYQLVRMIYICIEKKPLVNKYVYLIIKLNYV